jgi:hypothetical protein
MNMKLPGFFLLLAGWGLVLAAVVMLRAELPQAVFVLAGIAVELAGLALVVHAHRSAPGKKASHTAWE